jgi:hypothetical protein
MERFMTTTNPEPSVPRYGIRDDEMTKPGVVVFDWGGDEEATVVGDPPPDETLEFIADEDVHEEPDVDPSYDFTPRWQGIGRKPGTVALAVILGFCVAIGLTALLEHGDDQAGAQTALGDVALR